MADAFTSALVGHFVSRALQRIEDEVGMIKNVKEDVKKFKKSLCYIQDLLADAESRQLDSNLLKHWLSDLEDLSYNIDDVLDEWNSVILKSKIEKEQEGGDGDEGETSSAVPPKQVCFPVLSSCFCFKQANEVIKHRDFATRIKELNEKLDGIKKEGQDYGLVLGAIRQCPQQQNTTSSVIKPRARTISLVNENEIRGRDAERESLVRKLLGESRKRIDIIPIVGMGGLGKTTLAQLVYNEDRVKTNFDERIWVCVSEPFDLIQISKAVIEALGGNTQNCEQLETSVQRICELISGKKFLLVLDDVWTEDREEWEKLKQSLNNGVEGSRILVTTRKENVAKMMGATIGMITPKILSDGDCWEIIKQLAFVEGEDEEINRLQEIGRKIASKCKGLPLFAKILGSLMSLKRSKSEWEDILHNKLWESESDEFAPFLLSYYDLPPLEKCCFSYCSIFPKDYQIGRDQLIDLWMSQGYVDDFIKGQECFDSLAMRSFFQDFEKSERSGAICSCKMHDIMHDFAQFLTKNKSIIVERGSIKEKMESLHDKACNLT